MQNSKKLITLFFVLVTFMFGLTLSAQSPFSIGTNSNRLESSEAIPKIIIDGNWTATKSAGICIGNGTPASPYIIQDKTINAGGAGSCISIRNAHEYFHIENCSLTNSGSLTPDSGLYMQNVSNGVILDCVIANNRYGIYQTHCARIYIARNVFENENGVHYSTNCSNMWLYLNNFDNSYYDLFFQQLNSTTYHTPIAYEYTYQDQPYSGYLGNHWETHHGVDEDGDGIADNAVIYTNSHVYIVDDHALIGDFDDYILIGPWIPPPEEKIPGYNVLILIGGIALVIPFIIRKMRKM